MECWSEDPDKAAEAILGGTQIKFDTTKLIRLHLNVNGVAITYICA